MRNSSQKITTTELAKDIGLKPQTLWASVCRTGGYCGITPDRLPNGRLLWPQDTVDRLISSARKK